MAVTINLRKMLHRKSPEYCTPPPSGNTAAGHFTMADRDGFLGDNDVVLVAGASSIYTYSANEDSWMQLPNSGVAGTFGAGSCGCLRAVFAPSGANSSTASAGTTTSVTTTLTLTRVLSGNYMRVISGTGIGYQGAIVTNTLGTNSVVTVSPASGVAFDNTTVFQLLTGSIWFLNAGTPGFSVYDRATNTWTSRSVTGLPAWGTDGNLISVAGVSSNFGTGFVQATTTSASSTTLVDSGKTWPTNGWTNFQVRVISGTGLGQIRTITSNTATTLTVATWTVTPDATSVYRIEGNDDYIYLLGNNAVTMYRYSVSGNTWSTLSPGAARAGVAAVGATASWVDSISNSIWVDGTYSTHHTSGMLRQNGRYIYSFRGGAASTLDVYDIASNTWYSNVTYGGQMETFTTGSSATDVGDLIYIQKDATGRLFQYDIVQNALKPFTLNPVPQGTAIVGGKLFVTTFKESGVPKLKYLHSLSNTRSELVRWAII